MLGGLEGVEKAKNICEMNRSEALNSTSSVGLEKRPVV